MKNYKEFVIETYDGPKNSTTGAFPARPVAGQGLPPKIKVECSASMRKEHPVGTKFLVKAKLITINDCPVLYSSYRWPWRILPPSDAT